MRLRKRWVTAAAAFTGAALAVAVAPVARAIVVNGTTGAGVTTDWDGVGEILPTVSGIAPVTGTLLDATHVLTAAHAVWNGTTGSPFAPGTFTFQLGSDTYTAKSIVTAGYTGTEGQNDLAVITLTSPATGHATYAANTGQIANELSIPTVLVGYGVGGDGTNGAPPDGSRGAYGTKREAVNAIDQNTDTNPNVNTAGTLPAHLLAYDFDDASAGTNGPLGGPALSPVNVHGTLVPEGDTTNGDSGGPMFQFDAASGQYLITGVTIDGTTADSTFGDVSWGTRVQDFSGFLATAVPEPGSVALLFVGAAGVLVGRRGRRVRPSSR